MVPSLCAITRQVLSEPSRLSASWTEFSVTVSSAEVASSSMINSGSFNRQRAIAVLCFSPPESLRPRSPTMVSHPSGSCSMKSNSCASLAAFSSSSSVASRFPYRTLFFRVSLNMIVA
mmetsp:Transcript_1278/g.2828  ORF Transcript_1278/g.2828 Transcript_1278/m.2828 type:complete len:118 (-) Transcript_1278:178-531(-)